MTKQDRERRVVARGEFSNHSHVLVGQVEFDTKGHIIVGENTDVVLKHILEKEWVEEGKEIWTGEHTDIKLLPGTYEYVPQMVFDPLSKRIESARD
jgi:hypothetical protein